VPLRSDGQRVLPVDDTGYRLDPVDDEVDDHLYANPGEEPRRGW
jgi:hypothetical protein